MNTIFLPIIKFYHKGIMTTICFQEKRENYVFFVIKHYKQCSFYKKTRNIKFLVNSLISTEQIWGDESHLLK